MNRVAEYEGYDAASYNGPEARSDALPFKVLLESLVAALPDSLALDACNDLSTFIEATGHVACPELLRVSKGSAWLHATDRKLAQSS